MPNHISTRGHIPTQGTTGAETGAEDLPSNYAEILDEVKREVRTGYVAERICPTPCGTNAYGPSSACTTGWCG
jgi:hypothetical protein